MRAGSLRTLVKFQQPTEASDGYGGQTLTWGSDITVPCAFRAESGRESLETGRLESSVMAVLSVRAAAVPNVTAGWRAVIDNVNWNIRSVSPFGQRGSRVDIVIERGGDGVAV